MKNPDNFIDNLRNELNLGLPGEDAQFRMAPVSRERLSEIKARKPIISITVIDLLLNRSFMKLIYLRREFQ